MEYQDGFAATSTHNQTIASLSGQRWLRHHCYYVPKISGNELSMTFDLASWTMQLVSGDIKPWSNYRPPF